MGVPTGPGPGSKEKSINQSIKRQVEEIFCVLIKE